MEVGGIGRVVDLLDEGGQDASFDAFALAGAALSYEALHFIDLAAGEHNAQKQGVDVLVRMRLFQARQYWLEFWDFLGDFGGTVGQDLFQYLWVQRGQRFTALAKSILLNLVRHHGVALTSHHIHDGLCTHELGKWRNHDGVCQLFSHASHLIEKLLKSVS